MKTYTIALVLATAAFFAMSTGCTDNTRAKNFGGTATETLPAGKKFVNATWKAESLWILTRDAKPGEQPEKYEFTESSSFGVIQGKVIFIETAAK